MLGLSQQTNAILRHVYTALGTAVALLIYMGVSPDDQAKIVAAVHQIGDGFASIVAGLAVLVPIGSAMFARWTAKPAQQIAAVNAMPDVQVVPASGTATPPVSGAAAIVSSSWLIGLLGLFLLLPGCTLTTGLADMQSVTTAIGKAAVTIAVDAKSVATVACPVLPTLEQLSAAVNVAQSKYAASADAVANITCAVLAPKATATPLPTTVLSVPAAPLPAASADSSAVVPLAAPAAAPGAG